MFNEVEKKEQKPPSAANELAEVFPKTKNDKVEIAIKGFGNAKNLVRMMAWLEILGGAGHSAGFKVYADGDGNARWKFEFEDKEQQKLYEKLKKELVELYLNPGTDIESFEL